MVPLTCACKLSEPSQESQASVKRLAIKFLNFNTKGDCRDYMRDLVGRTARHSPSKTRSWRLFFREDWCQCSMERLRRWAASLAQLRRIGEFSFLSQVINLKLDETDYGGISGAPCFIVRAGAPIRLVGFATGFARNQMNMLQFTYARFIGKDGIIRYMSLGKQ